MRAPNGEHRQRPVDDERARRSLRERRRDPDRRTGHMDAEQEHQRCRETRRDPYRVANRHVPPPAAIEAKDDADEKLHGDDHQHRIADVGVLRRNPEFETEPLGERVAGRKADRVKCEQHEYASAGHTDERGVDSTEEVVAHVTSVAFAGGPRRS